MRCYKCGWGSDMQPRRTLLGYPYVVMPNWPPVMVFPNDEANKTGVIEIHGVSFSFKYLSRFDAQYVPLPYGPQVCDPDLFK